ncbi:DUF4270 domain-containing protein [Lacinutrix sp. C3R15]|uniref:DUF4270 domain-containing protein n=1 Tax=Flavobacteriaceae TaxID=49546 RepID=UPI001C0A5717|nr:MULTISPECIES: DUF4270 domain-containing protein [Flavobacteriaceae]MBU2940911.1 DUF4270 domain-containing protein [Lacinutrix sp. C3R15]MDO6624230.1 DUF4270 domain-containing protein [Oceanihabitans sp. 1_MG-2023]
MKKTIKALKITSVLSLISIAFIACDKDFSTLDSDIQGAQNFSTDSEKIPVIAYTKKFNPVQSNGLSSNLLGVYKDDIYGLTTASVVSQVSLSSYDPDFGDEPELESVILSIPYFSTAGDTVDGETTYTITQQDSLFGNAPIKLSIYKNNYFLKDFNAENIEEYEIYYSNANTTINFDNHTDELLFETDAFVPSESEITLNDETDDEEKLTPRFREELNNVDGFWEDLIFSKEGMTELSNDNNFKNYFRGLYFKASLPDGATEGNMVMLDFSNATIELNYTNETDELDDDGNPVREEQTLEINFSGNRLNILENDPSVTTLADADAAANPTEGNEKLYLKGGEGAMAVVDLFGGPDSDNDGLSDAYDDFIATYKDQRLINEANLVFYVDQTAGLNDEQEPSRVIIYDLKNNIPVVDYFLDLADVSDPEYSIEYHSTVLERDSDNNGVKYKIRLTEHLNNILLRDSTNLKLGLMVTTNINEVLQYSTFDSEDKLTSGTVMSPKGTVLHGSNENVAEENRVQLEIFYSEPEN